MYLRRFLIVTDFTKQIRNYSRWTHRRPVRILPSEEEREVLETTIDQNLRESRDNQTDIRWRHTPANTSEDDKIKKRTLTKNVKELSYDMLQTIIDANGEFLYTKLPDKDARVASILTSIQSNNSKKHTNVLLEGKRLIIEALESNCKLEYLLFSRKSDVEQLKPFLPKTGATLFKIPYKEIQLWSNLTTSPGVMGIFKIPSTENYVLPQGSIPLTIVCDNIREPGNLGSILRTCAGAGCESVILTKGCVNLWDTKVTRGACGAHFRLKIIPKVDWLQVEGHIRSNSRIFIADNKLLNSSNENQEEIASQLQTIPIIPYYGIHVDKKYPNVLIIGGETEGLSEDAYKFASGHAGVRLNVPLMTGIDSLNSSVALGVIIFEMKKQILLNAQRTEERIENVG